MYILAEEISQFKKHCEELQNTINDLQAGKSHLENALKSLREETQRKEESWMQTSLDLEEKVRWVYTKLYCSKTISKATVVVKYIIFIKKHKKG